MIKYTGFIKDSRTLDFQACCAVLVVVESNIGLIGNYLGNYADTVLFGVIIINVILRFITTKPLKEK